MEKSNDSILKVVDQLITQSKNLQEASKRKLNLESQLAQLTTCNNIAVLSRNRRFFNSNVIKICCKIVSNHTLSNVPSTLIITVKNISTQFTFSKEHWQFCISMNNDKTQCIWNLEKTLEPQQEESFCCPFNITKIYFNDPLDKVTVFLKFTIEFESNVFTKSFSMADCVIDVLYLLDPARIISPNTDSILYPNENYDFSQCNPIQSEQSFLHFSLVSKFLLRLDPPLKKMFLKEICLQNSIHRGFSPEIDNSLEKSEYTLYCYGIEINITFKNECVMVECRNPKILSALKSGILRRLVSVPGIIVEAVTDENKEKIETLRLQLATFQCNIENIEDETEELMKFYLELRDISESIRFSVVHEIE